MRDDIKERILKKILWGSITADIVLLMCFIIGISLGIGSVEFGFLILGFVFRHGFTIAITSFLLKLGVLVLSFGRDTDEKKKLFSIALSSMSKLLIIGGLVWGIYFIGKVMTAVG